MRKMMPVFVLGFVALLMSSCEKGYVCECSKPDHTEKELRNITAANIARAEVKCLSLNDAGPNKKGLYNCSLRYTDKEE